MENPSHLLYGADQVRELDRLAIVEHDIDGYDLMRRAGRSAFNLMRSRWPRVRRVTVLCGSGNNGGDGYVVARLARAAGIEARVAAVSQAKSATAIMAAHDYQDNGGDVTRFPQQPLPPCELLVDALLGTGLERDLAGPYAEAVRAVNDTGLPVLALDMPSGLHSDTGRVQGDAVRAAATVTFIGTKLGLLTGQGPDFTGTLYFDSLDVPMEIYAALTPLARRIANDGGALIPPRRARTAHKGAAGRVLIIGGDLGMMGAACLAAKAAYRSGAGLVRVATRPEHAPQVSATCPEVMAVGVNGPADLAPYAAAADIVAVGPGLGQRRWGRAMMSCVVDRRFPIVVDADALNLLADEPLSRDDWVLTPHPGEAARLLGTSVDAVQDDRPAAAAALRNRFGGVVVLKGAGTLVHDRGLWLCDSGNPGMATGGMGDVLTGVIAGLAAQGGDLSAAARGAVWLHGAAADQAAFDGETGMMASDLFAPIRGLINKHHR
jgi:NAD(P)H-hydrate epimerase